MVAVKLGSGYINFEEHKLCCWKEAFLLCIWCAECLVLHAWSDFSVLPEGLRLWPTYLDTCGSTILTAHANMRMFILQWMGTCNLRHGTKINTLKCTCYYTIYHIMSVVSVPKIL